MVLILIFFFVFVGFAAGSIFGPWSRKPIIGFNMGMLLGLAAVCRKEALQRGWGDILPPVNPELGGIGLVNRDFSFTKERPGNWTTE